MESRLEDHLRADLTDPRAEVQAWRRRWERLRVTLPRLAADTLYDSSAPQLVDAWLDDLEKQHPVGGAVPMPMILSAAGIPSAEKVSDVGSR